MQINHCLRCNHEWPSKLEKSRTCAKCRSPYWDVPKGTSNKPVADLPVLEKKSAASPIRFSPTEVTRSIQAQFPEHIRKPLYERSEEARKAIIESMRGVVDKNHPDYKTKPVTPEYTKPPVVEDQPSYDDFGPTIT